MKRALSIIAHLGLLSMGAPACTVAQGEVCTIDSDCASGTLCARDGTCQTFDEVARNLTSLAHSKDAGPTADSSLIVHERTIG